MWKFAVRVAVVAGVALVCAREAWRLSLEAERLERSLRWYGRGR